MKEQEQSQPLTMKQIILANLDNNKAVKEDVYPIHLKLNNADDYDYLGYSTLISKGIYDFYKSLYVMDYAKSFYTLHKLYFDISLFFISPLSLSDDGVETSDFINNHMNKCDLWMGMYEFCDYELKANLQRFEINVLNNMLLETFNMVKSDYYSENAKIVSEFPYVIPDNKGLNDITDYLTDKGVINLSPNLINK